MEKNYGEELFKILKLQRQTFIRNADNEKFVINHQLYWILEQELERLQQLIGLGNKRIIAKEMADYFKEEYRVVMRNFKKFVQKFKTNKNYESRNHKRGNQKIRER